MSPDALFSPGNVASFRMQVSRTTRKVRPGASQCPRASLGFDERNRLTFGHRLAPVLAMCSCQRRGQLEPDDLAFNDGCRVHDTSVRKEADQHKRRGHSVRAETRFALAAETSLHGGYPLCIAVARVLVLTRGFD